MNITYHITNRCNKNCTSCGHFLPLVPKSENHKDYDTVIEELELLSYYKEYITELGISGGEPTLHPNLREILIKARELFPNNYIRLDTNCLLKHKLIDLRDIIIGHNIHICASPYNIDTIHELEGVFGKNFTHYEISCLMDERGQKNAFYKGFFTRTATTTAEEALRCDARKFCVSYENKKIYPCQYSAYFEYFNQAFEGQHPLDVGVDYFVDITTRPPFEVIQNKVRTILMPMCYHCIDCRRDDGYRDIVCPITHSKRELNEWLIDK